MGTLKVCLDPGHYGNYNCNRNVTPVYWESRTVWKLHLMLKEELEKYQGVTVVTTRSNEEQDMAVYARGKAAKGCDLFLSLHTNDCETESVDRVTVIYQVKADERMKALAAKLGAKLKEVMGTNDPYKTDLRWNSAHNADYYGVLRGAAAVGVPGLILEHSFHSNIRMAKWLQVEANLRKIAVSEAALLAAEYGCRAIYTNPFTDVQEGKYYTEAIQWAVENGIVTGAAPDRFGVGENCRKEQVVTMLWRALGK